jgi:hypothetical protein
MQKVLKSWKQRYRIFRTALRGSRSRSSSKGTEEQGIIVRPQLDGSIVAAMDKDTDATAGLRVASRLHDFAQRLLYSAVAAIWRMA